ncbi:MAG: MBL fold metallo-hydrolase, partial [Veillonella sp.]|nr:MBL fold metallo-hydrolase [Veillonella sp.]
MLHVTFLAHSGFLVEDGKRCYVFDYYKDPNNIVWQLAKRGFDGPQTRYICHQDVPLEGKVKKCITMRPGQDAILDDVGIHMYGSTDEGGSFYVKTNTANIDSDSIFHAG